jgi:hypothetical protein
MRQRRSKKRYSGISKLLRRDKIKMNIVQGKIEVYSLLKKGIKKFKEEIWICFKRERNILK